MGGCQAGALNTSGFKDAIQQKILPQYHHITHPGIYNQEFFEVGTRAKELLELYSELGVSNCELFSMPKRNFFLSLFLKSSADGMPRDRNINACIVLDISGSMNSELNYSKPTGKTRLMLAKDAIWMFFEKLKPNDIFSLVVFHTEAMTVIQSQYVSKLNKENVKQSIYQNFQSGGTTIRNGFNEAIKQINRYRADITNYQNRIVMLTDVCDNSVENQKLLIQDISQNNAVNTTIIGVSSDFQSHTCQKLKEVKGFNYFSAVENSDLNTYLVDRFDYTFFPCVQNITIKLVSPSIKNIKVYGSCDQEKTYNKEGNTFIVSKMNSAFPSEINQNQAKNTQILSCGGLILVRFQPINPQVLPQIDLKVLLSYEDLHGKKFQKQYVIQQKILAQEYYSGTAIKKGVSLFYYAETIRTLLKIMGDNFNPDHQPHYIENLQKLEEYCPEGKKEELKKIIEIVKEKKDRKQVA